MSERLSPPAENRQGDNTEVGMFSRVENTRNVRGLLLPFNELSRPARVGSEPVMFTRGSVKLPRDHSVVTLNVEHSQFEPIGRAVSLEETDAGIVAEFAIADTEEGDKYLASGVMRKLSAEVIGLVRDAADNTRAAFAAITGAAVCAQGAFASAGLFSLAPEDSPTDLEALATDLDALAAYIAVVREQAQSVINQANAAEAAITEPSEATAEDTTPTAAPAEESTTAEHKEFSTMADSNAAGAQVPGTLLASAPAVVTERDVNLSEVFSAFASFKANTADEDAQKALFALADIKTTGTGALPASGVIQPNWVGKLWQGKEYTRKYLPLNTHTFGPIDLGGRAGYRLDQGTALVQKRTTGEKTELPTGTATTSRRESSRDSFGYAADVAAEWQYLTGGADILENFWKGVATSYAKVTDEEALATMFRVASRDTGAALSRRVAPQSLPAGTPANSAYYPGVVQLIQAIEAISDADDEAQWAVVNPILWQQLIFTPKDLLPEFIQLDVNIGTGEATVGKVNVRKAPQSAFIGTNAANPQVIAGSARAIEFKELGSTPIQIDALNVARFGVDRATVGFLETFVVRPESTVFIGTAA